MKFVKIKILKSKFPIYHFLIPKSVGLSYYGKLGVTVKYYMWLKWKIKIYFLDFNLK